MAVSISSNVIQRIIKGLSLNPAAEPVPTEVGRMIVPVFNSNIPLPLVREITDTVLNKSDKTFTVPKGKTWRLLYGNAILSTSATVGNRVLEIRFLDNSGNNLYRIGGINLAANSTFIYSFGQFSTTTQQTATALICIPIPINCFLPEGFRIRILDAVGVDPTADDLTIRLIVEEYDYSMI